MFESTWFWGGVAFVLYLLVVIGAYQCAICKDRSETAWGIVVAIFPAAFLLIALLPKSRGSYSTSDDSPRLTTCPACRKPTSSHAKSCPSCGNPISKSVFLPRLCETLGWISFVILAAAFGYQSTQFSSQSGGTDFPRCDSDAAKREVIAAIANAPLGKVAGINIIGWDDIRTIKDDYDQRICHAMVSLNTGGKTGASYKFTVHKGEIFVEFAIEDN